MDGGFGAPLGRQAAHSLVYVFVEARQVADYTAIQVGAVGVGVGQVGGFQLPVAEVVEDVLGGAVPVASVLWVERSGRLASGALAMAGTAALRLLHVVHRAAGTVF